jgi:transcriptional regulator with XRE-family HTH domain
MERRWVVSADYRSAIEAIVETRKGLGITQRELARRLNKHPSFTNKIENLERRIDILEFVAVARALGVEPTDLMGVVVSALPAEFEL